MKLILKWIGVLMGELLGLIVRLRDILQAKGYELHYDEQMHGHDSTPWPGLLAEGLRVLDLPL